jgi:hypothetical protein
MDRDSVTLKAPPIGYWIEDGRGKWIGPFGTEQEATEIATMLCPTAIKSLRLVVLGQFNVREVEIKIPRKKKR